MNYAFYKFLKAESAKKNEVSTGMELLDEAFKIPIGSALLINGQAAVGTTSLAIQLATKLTNEGKLVIYFDVFNSMLQHRINEINDDYFLIFKPWDIQPDQLLNYLDMIKEYYSDPVYIFDNIHFLESLWTNQWTFAEFARKIRISNPDATIIATQRKKSYSDFWPAVVTMTHLDNIYCEMEDGTNQLAGHTAKILGPIGSTKVYVDHFIGKISKAYEVVITGIKSGEKTKTSNFEMDGITARGAWNFVHEVGNKKRYELRID
jgi:hypothetical protein